MTVFLRAVLHGKAFLALAFVWHGALLLPACGKRSSEAGLILQCKISPQPPHVGPAAVSIVLTSGRNTPVSGAHLKLEADMNHPGMAPIFGNLTETSSGRYDGHVNFTMPGDWTVIVSGSLANGGRMEREVSVPGVRPD